MSLLARVLLGAAVHQTAVLLGQQWERDAKYALAEQVARSLSKPLLVIGGPYGASPWRHAFGLKAHGCGDLCVDMDARACTGCQYEPGDIRALAYPSGLFGAAFSSHVLEHMRSVEDLQAAWSELHRVSDHVFVCMPGKDSLTGWIGSGHHLWVQEMGPGMLKAEERGGLRRTALVTPDEILEEAHA